MRKSTMVTFTSGDRHRFEPPRTQTAFIDLTNLFAKKLLQPTWLENYKALGFQTNSSWRGKKIRVCCFCPEYPMVPGCRCGIKKAIHSGPPDGIKVGLHTQAKSEPKKKKQRETLRFFAS